MIKPATIAKKLSDLFADDRLNVITLAEVTAVRFTPKMTAKVHQWVLHHSRAVNRNNGVVELDEIPLDNIDRIV